MTTGGEPLAADLGHDPDLLGELFGSVTERRNVAFRYRGKQRTVDPYGLAHRLGHWYLVGPQRGDEGIRVFRVDRMERVEAGDRPGAFARPPRFKVGDQLPDAPWEAGDDDLVVEVRFDPAIAWWAVPRLTRRAEVREDGDGGATAQFPVSSVEAFIGWLIGLEDQAEVLGPPEVRERFIAHVRGAA